MTLEEMLTAIAQANGLKTVRVGIMPVGNRVVWTAGVHWEGYSVTGTPCSTGDSYVSIAEALEKAVAKAAANRVPPTTEIEQLPAF